jgi:ubiquinone/menaquinone biosynthesis C-methylase UbiE
MEDMMVKERISETENGITGEFNTTAYNSMMRKLRDKGWMETDIIIKSGIQSGVVLEIGPGPGYLGLEWLKNTQNTRLKGLEISEDMITIAEKNSIEYGLKNRVEYIKGDARIMPFDNNYFDAAFTNGSLHEWAYPEEIMNEIARVLKPGGKYIISDMKRNMSPLIKWSLWLFTQPKEIRAGLISSIDAAYTIPEIKRLIKKTNLQNSEIIQNMLGIVITGHKSFAS